jgi:hypothetical protein
MLVSRAGRSGIGVCFLTEAVIVSSPYPAHRLRGLNLPYVPGYRGSLTGSKAAGSCVCMWNRTFIHVPWKWRTLVLFGWLWFILFLHNLVDSWAYVFWYNLVDNGLYCFGIIWLIVDCTYFDVIWLIVGSTYFGIIWLIMVLRILV